MLTLKFYDMHSQTNEEACLVTSTSHSRVIVVLSSHVSVTIIACDASAPHVMHHTFGFLAYHASAQ